MVQDRWKKFRLKTYKGTLSKIDTETRCVIGRRLLRWTPASKRLICGEECAELDKPFSKHAVFTEIRSNSGLDWGQVGKITNKLFKNNVRFIFCSTFLQSSFTKDFLTFKFTPPPLKKKEKVKTDRGAKNGLVMQRSAKLEPALQGMGRRSHRQNHDQNAE